MVSYRDFQQKNICVVVKDDSDFYKFSEWLEFHEYPFVAEIIDHYDSDDETFGYVFAAEINRRNFIYFQKTYTFVSVEDLEPIKKPFVWKSFERNAQEIFLNYFNYLKYIEQPLFSQKASVGCYEVVFSRERNTYIVVCHPGNLKYKRPVGLYFIKQDDANDFAYIVRDNVKLD